MSHFAAAVTRGAGSWAAAELDLSGVSDIEEITDRLRDADPDAAVSLLFVESDDTYLVILRLDEGEDLRVFGSDSVFAEESRLGAILLGDIEEQLPEIAAADDEEESEDEDEDERPSAEPDIEPVGDPELLADLGMPSGRLLELCAQEGMLPADLTAEICQAIGAGDEIEELREL
ncbi:tRNA adenosine deaminase-associated protein [Dactylosporangium sp. AC04546]|uniref:tRNA adenosine deaminase-associated protein n=1 Tax=Dactylosporangium sp. AC04546 TaxID=2862460 RepID=UPI001EDCCFD8|nr:tRNA adenosine deaminase-associated protein [Dactylosporangium sp. AC04546]WVK83486.1 tRNA adenosine deaminase-associated protein [Dactylosporangium sp. AC04546]